MVGRDNVARDIVQNDYFLISQKILPTTNSVKVIMQTGILPTTKIRFPTTIPTT